MNHVIVSAGATAFTTGFLAVFVFLRSSKPVHRTFAVYSLVIALWATSFTQHASSESILNSLNWTIPLHAFAALIPVFFLRFTLFLTNATSAFPKSLKLCSVFAGFFIIMSLAKSPLLIAGVSTRHGLPSFVEPGPLYSVFFGYFLIFTLYGLFLLGKAYVSASGAEKNQLKYLFFGSLLGYIGGADNFLIVFDIKLPLLFPFGTYAVPIYTFVTTYAILRYRLMEVNLALTRATVFMAVYTAILGIPLLFAASWQDSLEATLGKRWWVGLWILCAGLASTAHYINLYLQRRAEDRLLAESRRYQAVLRQASQGMTLIKELDKLLNLIVHLLTRKVRIKHAAIYLWDEAAKHFTATAARQWHVEEAPTFHEDDPLIQYFKIHRAPIVTAELKLQMQGGTTLLEPMIEQLEQIKASVLVPSFVEDKCQGFLVLGDKLSEGLYSHDDLQVFQVLASQAALAIENAQFYEELKRTQADLFQTAKMASLGHMAGGMSHQINNRFHVLTILAGTLKSVIKDIDPTTLEEDRLKLFWGKTVETMEKIEENSLRGGDIVKTLLKFSRPSGGYQAVGVRQIVQTALDVVQFRANFSEMDFTVDIPENVPPVLGDLNQLSDSCFNLISNAYDAISKRKELIENKQLEYKSETEYRGTLDVTAKIVRKDKKNFVGLAITDNGCGMSKDDLASLFVPFFTTKATAQKGTGLGLYIIQRILEQHGGEVETESEYGVGTTFTLLIPEAPAEQAAEVELAPMPAIRSV